MSGSGTSPNFSPPRELDPMARDEIKAYLHDTSFCLGRKNEWHLSPANQEMKLKHVKLKFSAEPGESDETYTLKIQAMDLKSDRVLYSIADLDLRVVLLTESEANFPIIGETDTADKSKKRFHALTKGDTYVFISSEQGGSAIDRPPASPKTARARVMRPANPMTEGTVLVEADESSHELVGAGMPDDNRFRQAS